MTVNKTSNSNNQTWLKDNHVWGESLQVRHPTDMVNGKSHKMNTSDFCMYGGCGSTYIQKRPNIGNALRGLLPGTQLEKDSSNKARVLSHMSLGVISTKHQSDANTAGQSGPGGDDNDGVRRIPQSLSFCEDPSSDCLVLHPVHSLVGVVLPLLRDSWCVLQPKLTAHLSSNVSSDNK